MNYHTFKATGLLKNYVKHFWVLEGKASPDKPYVHNFFADTCPEMIFYYKGVFHEVDSRHQRDTIIKTGVTGPGYKHKKLISTGNFGVFGVYFYPHAIAQLFSIEASELKNQMLDLREILGKEQEELEEKMVLAESPEKRLKVICSFLEKKVVAVEHTFNPIIVSIQQIQKVNGIITIEELASHISLSTRQFERNFLSFSGLSPKLFTRIVRFQSALKRLNHIDTSLTKVAYEADYYDQAHFIRDFKIFSGLRPREFMKYHQKNSLWLLE